MTPLASRALWAALLLPLAMACAAEPRAPEAQPMLAQAGADAFQQYCTSCHGADGRGRGPAADALRRPPADLTRIAARRGGEFPDAEIASFIDGRFELAAHGTREMPVWGRRLQGRVAEGTGPDEVTRGVLVVLVEYLKTIQRD